VVPVLFYDLETFGLRPGADRIAEFAGILTDDELSLRDQPWEHRCLPPPDMLASPGACLTTGITPQMAQQTGLPEPDFARTLNGRFQREPRTLIVGYNNASFDDEFIRHLFYRTFLDPYEWHWVNGNRRLDMFAVIPAVFDFQRDALVWPRADDGRPDFRLEALSAANDAESGTSHEALADTFALRNVCNAIRVHAPEVWERLPDLVSKNSVEQTLRRAFAAYTSTERASADSVSGLEAATVAFSAGYLKRENRSSTLCAVVGREAGPAGAWWLVDLAADPEQLLAFEPEVVAARRFATGDPERERFRTLIRLNPRRLPVLFPAEERHRETLYDHGIARSTVADAWRIWVQPESRAWLARYVAAVAVANESSRSTVHRDVDEQLYDALPHADDRRHVAALAHASTREIGTYLRAETFTDPRYRELAQRFFGRYLPTWLSSAEREQFRHGARARIDVAAFDAAWERACSELETSSAGRSIAIRRRVLAALQDHRQSVVERLGIAGHAELEYEKCTGS
jgi:exodeoxyribonuclease-1